MPKSRTDLGRYEIQFTRLLTVPTALEHFKSYLKEIFCEESLEFILAVTEFKSNKQVALLCNIYNTFLKDHAEKELNVPKHDREKVLQQLNQCDQFKQDTLLVDVSIFDAIYIIVYRELREDAGARYIRSKSFQTFVDKMGEDFLLSIALDISQKAYEDVILTEEDFSQKTISQKDVNFFMQVLSDSTEWQATSDPGTFFSKTRYTMVKENNRAHLFKSTGYLECNAYQALVAGCDPVALRKVNKGLETNASYLDSINEGEYPCIIRYATIDVKISKHDLYTIVTIVYDPTNRCYMLISKTTDAYQDKYPLVHKPVRLFHCSAFYEISEQKSRFVTVSWVDLGLGSIPRFLEKLFVKPLLVKRGKMVKSGFTIGTEEMRKVGFVPNKFEGNRSMLDTLEEFFKRNPDKDPTTSSQISVEEDGIGE